MKLSNHFLRADHYETECRKHGKNDFAEGSKNLLDTNLKTILLNYQNNFVRTLKITSNAAKKFDILATRACYITIILIVQQNYFFVFR